MVPSLKASAVASCKSIVSASAKASPRSVWLVMAVLFNSVLVIPLALTLSASEFISIVESSTPTDNTELLADNPSPASKSTMWDNASLLVVLSVASTNGIESPFAIVASVNSLRSKENVLEFAPSKVPPLANPSPAVKALGTFKTDKVSLDNSKVLVSAALVWSIVPLTLSVPIAETPEEFIVTSPDILEYISSSNTA